MLKDPGMVNYEFSVELQFEFEWLKRAINCSKWAISLQVGMRSLKGSTSSGAEHQHRRIQLISPALQLSSGGDMPRSGDWELLFRQTLKIPQVLQTTHEINPNLLYFFTLY